MSTKELRSQLADTIKLHNELYDFCIECIKDIFYVEQDQKNAIAEFENSYEAFEVNGCIPGLAYLKKRIECWRKEREEILSKSQRT